MPNTPFGSRRHPPRQGAEPAVDKYSKVDFVRGVIAATIHQFGTVPEAERDSLAMRIRILQDQLAALKRGTAVQNHKSQDLAWVDIWRPD